MCLPHKPVSRAGGIDRIGENHGIVVHVSRVLSGNGLTEGLARSYQSWTDDTPSKGRATKERPGSVETGEHSYADKCRSPLPDPVPTFNRDDPLPAKTV